MFLTAAIAGLMTTAPLELGGPVSYW